MLKIDLIIYCSKWACRYVYPIVKNSFFVKKNINRNARKHTTTNIMYNIVGLLTMYIGFCDFIHVIILKEISV